MTDRQEESQFKFLMRVFQAISESKGNPQVIYPLFRDNLALLDESLILLLTTWHQTKFAEVDEDSKKYFAAVVGDFANFIAQFPLGIRLINLELAIACCSLALEVFTHDAYSEQWAGIQMNLANIYSDRIRGQRAANLEQSIRCCSLALEVFTHDAYPEQWAMTQNNLANAYRERIKGERAANLEQSIDCYKLALSVYTFEAYRGQWADTQNNLANVYRERIKGERAANVEQSIDCYKLALSIRTRDVYPQQWAETKMNLANAYRERIQGERAANLELAVSCCQSALSVYTFEAYPERWAGTQINLAITYYERIQGERAANLEQSFVSACHEVVKCYEQALDVYIVEAYPERWAMTQENIAILYTGEGKNEEAIHHYQQALEVFIPAAFPINALKANRGLGHIYFKQGEWQLAVDTYAVAIEAAETSRNWATNEDERQRIIREAISVYENTIQAYINIGRIDLAITTSERARSRQLVDFMRTNDLYPQGTVPDRVEKYVAVTKELQQYHQSENPAEERSLTTTNRSYTRAERTAAVVALETERQTILQKIREKDAIAAGKMAVIPIELPTIQSSIKNHNTAILSFYTTDDDTHIFIITQTGSPQLFTLPGQGLQTFQQWLYQQWSLPYMVDDFKANINEMTPEEQQEFIVRVNDIDEKLLTRNWRERMNDNLAAIADRLQLPQLIAQLPTNITELIVIPHLSLHQIPFAALPLNPLLCDGRRFANGGVPERRGGFLLGDSFTIRYVPSCQILQYCTERPALASPRHGTVADTDGTLPGSAYESDRVAEICQILEEFRLRGKQASKANYLDLLAKVNNLLSSHHASSRLDRPQESCLKLADNVLTLGEIFTSRYPDLNEIFLSCCETHLGTTIITDDILTLATGFLCAGARSVIGTLWQVNDLATSIFTIHYYEQRDRGVSGSEAIQRAQRYLRNLTKEQFATFQASFQVLLIARRDEIEAEFKHTKTQPRNETIDRMLKELRAAFNTIQQSIEELEQLATVDRPFAHPYYWAGFTCQGL
jgi:CHAT domain-containing protein